MRSASQQKEFVRSISDGDLARFRRLLKSGIDVNLQDDIGWSPLFYAVSAGDAEMVVALLEAGADPHAVDNSGWTPIGHAHLDGSSQVWQLLQK